MNIVFSNGGMESRLAALVARLRSPRPVVVAGVGAIARELRRHFTARDQKPNRLGGQRTHFWRAIRNSTVIGEISERKGSVVIGDPRFRIKLRGGVIKAKNVTYLTIPVDPAAYGKRARVFERESGLKLFFVKQDWGGLLASNAEEFWGDDDGDTGGFKVHYILKRRVRQRADANALPPKTALERAAFNAARAALARLLRTRGV